MSLEERFWKFVRKTDGCWEWTGQKSSFGYGHLFIWISKGVTPKAIRAHRLSYIIHHGSIPDGLSVLHHCDNPECTNPSHLYAGTQADNVSDMYKRKRIVNVDFARGERSHLSVISESQAIEVLDRHKKGQTARSIHEEMKLPISIHGVRSIIARKSWRHLA